MIDILDDSERKVASEATPQSCSIMYPETHYTGAESMHHLLFPVPHLGSHPHLPFHLHCPPATQSSTLQSFCLTPSDLLPLTFVQPSAFQLLNLQPPLLTYQPIIG